MKKYLSVLALLAGSLLSHSAMATPYGCVILHVKCYSSLPSPSHPLFGNLGNSGSPNQNVDTSGDVLPDSDNNVSSAPSTNNPFLAKFTLGPAPNSSPSWAAGYSSSYQNHAPGTSSSRDFGFGGSYGGFGSSAMGSLGSGGGVYFPQNTYSRGSGFLGMMGGGW